MLRFIYEHTRYFIFVPAVIHSTNKKRSSATRDFFCLFFVKSRQVLTQMTPQIIGEVDTLLGNKPHSKKEARA